jgi:hypothetical protein
VEVVRSVLPDPGDPDSGRVTTSHPAFHFVFDNGGFPINRAPLEGYQHRLQAQNRHEQMWLQHVDGTYAAVDLGIAAFRRL